MCGIVGRAGTLTTDDEKVFKTLLLLDYFRGQDSTGVAIVSKAGKVDVLKVADDPIMLFNHTDYESSVVGVSDAIWIGHNRAATVGITNRSNAHPFRCDHITGVHNGTLDKECFVELAGRMNETFGTDSETIFQHIALYGVEDTIPRLRGAWALVWYDEKERTLNMVKNEKRPLYLCKTTRGNNEYLTWASEFKMIVAARAMCNVNDGVLQLDPEGFGYWELPNDTLHTWTKTQLMNGDLEPTTSPLKGSPPLPVVVYKPPVGFVGNANNSSGTGSTSGNTGKLPFSLVPDTLEQQEIEIEESELILGIMDQEEWAEISRFGCSCCSGDVDPEDEGLVVYTNEGVVICPKCSDEPQTLVSNAFGLNLTNKITGN